jgi:hypothetical protein
VISGGPSDLGWELFFICREGEIVGVSRVRATSVSRELHGMLGFVDGIDVYNCQTTGEIDPLAPLKLTPLLH